MGVTITVDLANSTPSDIARAAKFMLEFAGYQDPSVDQAAHNAARDSWVGSQTFPEATGGVVGAIVGGDPRGSLGEEVHPEPTTAFAAGTPEAALQQAVAAKPTHGGFIAPPEPAPADTLPPPPPGIEVDAQGVPWDVRIHAGSRAKIADGTWRQKRNLDPEVYKAVMDELRHTMGVERRAPQPPAPPAPQQVFAPHPPVPPVPVVPTHGSPELDADAEKLEAMGGNAGATLAAPVVPPAPFVPSVAPPAPPISSTPPVPVSAGAATGASPGNPGGTVGKAPTFPELVKRITAAFNAKTMTQADVSRAVAKVGLTALPMLAARPDLVGDVATELGIAL